jgi:hypothetical protein
MPLEPLELILLGLVLVLAMFGPLIEGSDELVGLADWRISVWRIYGCGADVCGSG